MKSVKAGWAAVAALAAMSTVVSARAEPLKNIVLVHGLGWTGRVGSLSTTISLPRERAE